MLCFLLSNSIDVIAYSFSSQPKMHNSETIIEQLKVRPYYPKKLSWMKVITISEHESHEHCLNTTKGIIMLDYRAPFCAFRKVTDAFNHTIPGNESSEIDRFIRSLQINKDPDSIHPMDVMNVIYNCSDNKLLPILIEKLFLCQLSIPLVLPDRLTNVTTVQLWALRGIVPEFISANAKQTCRSLVDIPHLFICFARIGELKMSKSKFLNSLLRLTHHDTFFHRDCKNGTLKRVLSNGTVEAAWFQPSGQKSSEYESMFCILNLRGESTEHLNEAEFMCKIASLNILMIDTSNLKSRLYEKYVTRCKPIEAMYILCFVTGSVADVHLGELKNCMEYFSVNFQITQIVCNWQGERLLNLDEWKGIIKNVLVQQTPRLVSRKMSDDIFRIGREASYFCIDEDEFLCRGAFQKTQLLHECLNNITPTERKLKMLPLQGTFWKNWCTLQKELYRNSIASGNIDKFISKKTKEKQNIRRKQLATLQSDSSRFIVNFCSILNKSSEKELFSFFAWVKIILDDRCNETMPDLRNRFVAKMDELRQIPPEDESYNVCKKELQHLGDEMCNASFGLEHIFREIGQAYEVVYEQISSAVVQITNQTEIFLTMPLLMARLVVNGMPLELLDGDTAFPLMTWIKAVFGAIQGIVGIEKRIFVISVLGIQSSGKSTLLNTMFGLQFSVSAGRCTRGAFCQLDSS